MIEIQHIEKSREMVQGGWWIYWYCDADRMWYAGAGGELDYVPQYEQCQACADAKQREDEG